MHTIAVQMLSEWTKCLDSSGQHSGVIGDSIDRCKHCLARASTVQVALQQLSGKLNEGSLVDEHPSITSFVHGDHGVSYQFSSPQVVRKPFNACKPQM